jgi:hypothetical protein
MGVQATSFILDLFADGWLFWLWLGLSLELRSRRFCLLFLLRSRLFCWLFLLHLSDLGIFNIHCLSLLSLPLCLLLHLLLLFGLNGLRFLMLHSFWLLLCLWLNIEILCCLLRFDPYLSCCFSFSYFLCFNCYGLLSSCLPSSCLLFFSHCFYFSCIASFILDDFSRFWLDLSCIIFDLLRLLLFLHIFSHISIIATIRSNRINQHYFQIHPSISPHIFPKVL